MKRIAFLDYIRIIACFMVLLVHASENFYASDNGGLATNMSLLATEADRLWVSVYDGFCRMSVPLFMIVSAFLLAPMKEGVSSKQFYIKRFARILPPVAVFMVLYSTVPQLWGQIDIEAGMNDLARIPLNFPSLAGHLWFMYPLISIYLFIPIVSPWLRKVGPREERFFILLFLISTCIPFLNRFCGEVWGQCFWNEYHALWYFSGYLGYLVIAHYIHHRLDWSTSRRLWVGFTLMAVGAFVTIYSFYIQAVPGQQIVTPELEIGWAFCTINCVMLTVGAFLMFTCIRRENAIIAELSRLSFSIYLMHLLWLPHMVEIFKNRMELPTVAAIPAIAVGTFILCVATAKILSYVPGCKYLFGIETPSKKQIASQAIA